MRECYHKECDKFNTSIATKDKYKFMTSLVQSLVLSVAEMAMNNLDQENSKCISDTLDYLNEKQEVEEVESKGQDTREGNLIEGLIIVQKIQIKIELVCPVFNSFLLLKYFS